MGAVDDYTATLDPAARAAFEHVMKVVLAVTPDAEQGKSYGMPALKHEGRPLIGFRAAKQHLSIFPFSAAVVDAVRGQLEGFDVSKGTVRFAASKPPPDEVVREMVRLRLDELAGR